MPDVHGMAMKQVDASHGMAWHGTFCFEHVDSGKKLGHLHFIFRVELRLR
jgi:hypothetical protein